MSHSRKKYRVPLTQSSIDDSMSVTTEGSSSTPPAQLRNQSSVASTQTMKQSSSSRMPYRGDPSESGGSSEGTPGSSNGGLSSNKASVGYHPAPIEKQLPQSNYVAARPFTCTFAGCIKIFKTQKELIKHKIADDEGHDYCTLCDLDFQDDESLHLHKLATDKHICCPICSEDFRSEGGRDRHFIQMHAAEQNINCRGCGKHFFKGAALMSHIEKNQCPKIQNYDFETQRAIVANNMSVMSTKDDDEYGLMSLRISTVADSSVGGVPIANSILDNEETPEALNMMPILSRIRSNDSSATSTASVTRSKVYQNSYPALGSDPTSKVEDKGKAKIDSSTTSGSQPVESWAKRNFPDAPATPAPADWTPAGSSNSGYADTVDTADGPPGHFRIMDMKRNLHDGLYHCPFNNCPDPVYPSLQLMADHLGCGYHRGFENRCVGCLRVFKTPSALTAHMESNSARCQVRDSRQFGNALNLVSGGFLGMSGRHADGSPKIDSTPRPAAFTPTNW